MLEIFIYTERIVNMIRPRKLLFMAIGTYNYNCEIYLVNEYMQTAWLPAPR
jgi:hypothetical protein